MIYLLAIVLGFVICFLSFVSEIIAGNICHLKNGRQPNAGAVLFPTVAVIPTLAVGAAWLLKVILPAHCRFYFSLAPLCFLPAFGLFLSFGCAPSCTASKFHKTIQARLRGMPKTGTPMLEQTRQSLCQPMNTRPSELQTSRGRCFFWLGVFVLPLFWSWFTLSRKFGRRERLVAFVWLAVFLIWLLHQRSALVGQFETVSFVYPVILGWVTVALYVWLLFRTGFPVTFIEIIVLVDVVGLIHPSILFVDLVGQPFKWEWLLPAGIAILLHLILEPLGLGRGCREEVA